MLLSILSKNTPEEPYPNPCKPLKIHALLRIPRRKILFSPGLCGEAYLTSLKQKTETEWRGHSPKSYTGFLTESFPQAFT
jgi:hypothetical protein